MTGTSLARQVLAEVTFHDLVQPGECVLLPCRGDAPGLALGHALADLGPFFGFDLRLTLLHIAQPLSPEPTDAEAAATLVAQLADARGLDLRLERLDVLAGGAEAGAARQALVTQVATDVGARRIADPACADDRAASVLAAVISGTTSPAALAGPPVQEPWPALVQPPSAAQNGTPEGRCATSSADIVLIRPLWRIGREAIERDLRERGIEPATLPPSPAGSPELKRIRDELIPTLAARYNPRVREALVRLAESIAPAPRGR
jgi:tRNA(Ile)-lysidine synthase TilS/MesJ